MIKLLGRVSNLFSKYSNNANRDFSKVITNITFGTIKYTTGSLSINTHTFTGLSIGLKRSYNIPVTTYNYSFISSSIVLARNTRHSVASNSYIVSYTNINLLRVKTVIESNYTFTGSDILIDRKYNITTKNYLFTGNVTTLQNLFIHSIDSKHYLYNPQPVLSKYKFKVSKVGYYIYAQVPPITTHYSLIVDHLILNYLPIPLKTNHRTNITVDTCVYTFNNFNKVVEIPTFNLVYHMFTLNVLRHISVKILHKDYLSIIPLLKINRLWPITNIPYTYNQFNLKQQFIKVGGRGDYHYYPHPIDIQRNRVIQIQLLNLYFNTFSIGYKIRVYSVPVVSRNYVFNYSQISVYNYWKIGIDHTPYTLSSSSIDPLRNLDRGYSDLLKVYIITDNNNLYLVG